MVLSFKKRRLLSLRWQIIFPVELDGDFYAVSPALRDLRDPVLPKEFHLALQTVSLVLSRKQAQSS